VSPQRNSRAATAANKTASSNDHVPRRGTPLTVESRRSKMDAREQKGVHTVWRGFTEEFARWQETTPRK